MLFKKSIEFDLNQAAYCKVIFERYDLIRQIYSSSLSYIYLIKDKFTDQLYTLKAVKKHADIEFSLEDIKKIIHPRIAPVVHYGSSEYFQYIVKPYQEGLTLKHFVKQYGPLNDKKVGDLLKDLIDIFKYLHNHKQAIIYRDLKPDNIICMTDGHYHLIDTLTCRTLKRQQTSDTFHVGTVGFASPEQYGYGQSDERSDVYTIGATLFYAVTGELPYSKDSQSLKRTLKKASVKRKYRNVILKCMQFNPNHRYQCVSELVNISKRDYLSSNVHRTSVGSMMKSKEVPHQDISTIDSFQKVSLERVEVIDDIQVIKEEQSLVFTWHHDQLSYLHVVKNYDNITEALLKKHIYDFKKTGPLYGFQNNSCRISIVDKECNYLLLAFDKAIECIGYQRVLASKLADAGLIEFNNRYIKDIPLDHGIIVSTFREELYLHIYKDIMREELRHFKYVMIKSYVDSVTDMDLKAFPTMIKENPYILREYVEDGNRSGPTPGKTCKETDWAFALVDEEKKILKTYKIHYINQKR